MFTEERRLSSIFEEHLKVHNNLTINNETLERVSEYKYLGTIINCKLNFEENVSAIYKKANSRMFFVRKLHNLSVDSKIVEQYYRSVVGSVVTFGIVTWYVWQLQSCFKKQDIQDHQICKKVRFTKCENTPGIV